MARCTNTSAATGRRRSPRSSSTASASFSRPPRTPKPPASTTPSDKLLDGYLHEPQSKETLYYQLKHARRAFGKTRLPEITEENVRKWFAGLTLKGSTRRGILKSTRQAFRFGIELGYLERDPSRHITIPRQTERKHPFESWDEVYAVANAFKNPTYRALTIFACLTGLRTQEWRALRWRDIDWNGKLATINQTVRDHKIVEGEAKTDGSLRQVELADEALNALRGLTRPIDRDELIFQSSRGNLIGRAFGRLDDPPTPWRKALEAAGVELRSPGQLRHTFATLSLASGASIDWIAKQMGHTNTATTERHYRKWIKSDRRNITILNTALAATGQKTDSDAAGEGTR